MAVTTSPTTPRTVSLRVIVNPDEADAIRQQAQAEDRTVSDYLRWLAKQHGQHPNNTRKETSNGHERG